MPRFPEVLQFRAPTGATQALADAAKAEGRPAHDILREALAARLAASSQTASSTAKAA